MFVCFAANPNTCAWQYKRNLRCEILVIFALHDLRLQHFWHSCCAGGSHELLMSPLHLATDEWHRFYTPGNSGVFGWHTTFGQKMHVALPYWTIGCIYEARYRLVVALPVLLAEAAPKKSAVACAYL